MAQKLSLKDLDVKNKKVLMRVDFNVPLKNGQITDDTRIKAALPSIKYVIEHGGTLILMSHLGRPKDKPVPEFSLAPCAKRLEELLKRPVHFAPDCIGEKVADMASHLKPGEVLLLENLRFHKGEEHPEEEKDFVSQLAKLGDIYVNDAFGTAHRAHSSTALIAKFFPGKAAAGFLMENEIQFLGNSVLEPQRPFIAIIGGAKISSKIGVLRSLLKKVDVLMVGGGMAYTFFKAKGISIGSSIHEDDYLEETKKIEEECKNRGVKLLLPVDNVITNNLEKAENIQIIESKKGIPEGFQGADIGPKTIELFSEELQKAKTVLWNGPMGVFEIPPFNKGTDEIAKVLATIQAVTIVGGGDSVAAIHAAGVSDKISHISTGGGASLEYIEQGKLPGIEALSNK